MIQALPTARQATDQIKNVLAERLRQCATEDRIATYDELSELAGFRVDSASGRYYINVARDFVLEEDGIYFKVVRKVGYSPVGATRMAGVIGSVARQKINGATERWRTGHDAVKPKVIQTMSQAEFNEFIKEGLKLAVQEQLISEEKQRKLDQASEKQVNLMSKEEVSKQLNEMLEAMKGIG